DDPLGVAALAVLSAWTRDKDVDNKTPSEVEENPVEKYDENTTPDACVSCMFVFACPSRQKLVPGKADRRFVHNEGLGDDVVQRLAFARNKCDKEGRKAEHSLHNNSHNCS